VRFAVLDRCCAHLDVQGKRTCKSKARPDLFRNGPAVPLFFGDGSVPRAPAPEELQMAPHWPPGRPWEEPEGTTEVYVGLALDLPLDAPPPGEPGNGQDPLAPLVTVFTTLDWRGHDDLGRTAGSAAWAPILYRF
jgi:hypothetical protein